MRSARLMLLLLLLQTHERMTSKELAHRFEVPQRTILRDVEALSAAGVPVHTERGRHGAIVLDRRARLDPARLDPTEVQLLTLSGLDPKQLENLGLLFRVRGSRCARLADVASHGRSSSHDAGPLNASLPGRAIHHGATSPSQAAHLPRCSNIDAAASLDPPSLKSKNLPTSLVKAA